MTTHQTAIRQRIAVFFRVFADSGKHRNAVEKSRRSRVYATLRFFTQTIRTKACHARIQAVGPQSRKRCAPAFGVAHLLSAAELRTAQSAALGSGIGEIHVRGQPFENEPRSHEQRFARCSRCRSAAFLAHRHTLDPLIISRANPILVQPNANFAPRSVFQLTTNSANSNYQALQVQYRKPLANGLQALLNYSWSHSIDNASNDNVAVFSNTLVPLSAQGDRGNSDFDVRHSFSGAVTYTLPSVGRQRAIKYVTEGWSVDGVAVARSGVPFNAALLFSSPGPIGRVLSRPDLVPGQPFWIAQPGAPGGKILNSILDPNTGAIIGGAFLAPSAPRQGTEGRNVIPGFGLTQVDLSVGRKFPITERVSLQFRTDAFNVFNHPNFSNPSGILDLGDPTQLQAPSMLNVGLGGLNPLFQEGGPRSLQLSLRLTF